MPQTIPARGAPGRARWLRCVLRAMPTALCCASGAWFVAQGLSLLRSVGRPGTVDGDGLMLAAGALLASVVLSVTVEVLRVASSYRAPEQALRLAMQRIRAGDVGFRVNLRRGDPLIGLARECNELLEWLNVNRPPGVRGGGDIVEVQDEPEESLV